MRRAASAIIGASGRARFAGLDDEFAGALHPKDAGVGVAVGVGKGGVCVAVGIGV